MSKGVFRCDRIEVFPSVFRWNRHCTSDRNRIYRIWKIDIAVSCAMWGAGKNSSARHPESANCRGRKILPVYGVRRKGFDAGFRPVVIYNSPGITSPPSTTLRGRPSGLMFSWLALTFSELQIVRNRSCTVTGELSTADPPEFEAP